jgi:Pvc16 N-terminal domain
MSNALALAAVTASLRQLLQVAVSADVPGAVVTSLRPDAVAGGPPVTQVNVYLYQVTPAAAWRGADLPTRRADGQVVLRPQVALVLHYLVSCYGDDNELQPQRLLGAVVRTLHARPILPREMIRALVTGADFPYLQDADLADAPELVRFTPVALTLEELSKLWSVFFQTPYALSVAYQASVVMIDAEEEAQPAPPVQERAVAVGPLTN